MNSQSVSSALGALSFCLTLSSGCSERSLGDARRDNAITSAPPVGPPANVPGNPTPGASAQPPSAWMPPPGPVIGEDVLVSGGACAPGCRELGQQYGNAFERAQHCTPGQPDQCGRLARSSVTCWRCKKWVNDPSEISALAERYRQECGGCFLGGDPAAQSCGGPACPDGYGVPKCVAIPGRSDGLCLKEFDLPCPADVQMGMACAPPGHSCARSEGPRCECLGDPPSWFCVPAPTPAVTRP